MTKQERREMILEMVDEMVERFLVTDRKDDHLLPLGAIEEEVLSQNVGIWEMIRVFDEGIRKRIPVPKDS